MAKKVEYEVYLEGIRTPCSAVNITETEFGYPSASLSFPAQSGSLRILEGTIVQVFGTALAENTAGNGPSDTNEKVLLFEGEVTGHSYSLTSGGRSIALMCSSLLNRWDKAQVQPTDSIVTDELARNLHLNTVWPQTTGVNEKSDETSEQTAVELANISGTKIDISDIKINKGFDGVIGAITQLFNRATIQNGDYTDLIQTISAYFETYDVFYGIASKAFKIPESILVLPNPIYTQFKFQNQLQRATLNNLRQNSSLRIGDYNQIGLNAVLNEVLKVLRYKLITPAAPLKNRRIHTTDPNNIGPIRVLATPDLDTSPPPLCNVFFRDQVTDVDYSRAMNKEITRVIGQGSWRFVKPGSTADTLSPTYMTPNLKIDKETGQTALTQEEALFGVRPHFYKFDGPFYKAIQDEIDEQKAGTAIAKLIAADTAGRNNPIDEANWLAENDIEKSGPLAQAFQLEGAQRYFKMKYGQRTASFTCDWSPYRIIGFPAVFIDTNGPSILGVLSSINTSINAAGQAISSVTMRNVQVIYEEDFTSPFVTVAPNDAVDPVKGYLLKDYGRTTDYFYNTSLYDGALYNGFNIGMDIYSYILFGKGHKRKKLNKLQETYTADGAGQTKEAADLPVDNAKQRWAGLDELNKDTLARPDQSIFYSIRKPISSWTDEQKSDNVGNTTLTPPRAGDATEPLPIAGEYAYQIYNSIQSLIKDYKSIEAGGSAEDIMLWETLMNWRPLVPKDMYLKSIGPEGVTNTGHLKDYKDAISIMGAAENVDSIKDDIVNNKDSEASEVTTGSTEDLLNEAKVVAKAAFRPYNLTSRAHVLEGLKDYINVDGTLVTKN
jgi:hypothetical protein